ncbi:lysine N(6)-hydroxylase/L-ornithine N(5)-oxygenase family protein [Pseudomonas graminis]
MVSKTYDFIAVGIGPFNLSLACLTQPINDINGLFIDQKDNFEWHPGMMLENSTMQTPFLSDLVTLASPTHPLSFLSYIKQQGKIYSFYIRESFFLMRKEYGQYCQWAASKLDNLRFNTKVEAIHYDDEQRTYRVQCSDTRSGAIATYYAKKLIFGTGNTPYVPECCKAFRQQLTLSADYLKDKAALQQQPVITIIGSGQSAAEIFYDLLDDVDKYGYTLNWVTRSPRFSPLEYSKLTLEMTSPDYVDYFYHLPAGKKDALNASHRNLYKGINASLINDIFDRLYIKRLDGELKVNLFTNSELRQLASQGEGKGLTLSIFQQEEEKPFSLNTRGLILASGYQHSMPAFMDNIRHRIRWDEQGRYDVQRNYSIGRDGDIFVQNMELHTHGFVTPDLGMACYRNSCLIRDLTGVEHYPIEHNIAFQQFTTPRKGVPS